jgi:hypothetical protein
MKEALPFSPSEDLLYGITSFSPSYFLKALGMGGKKHSRLVYRSNFSPISPHDRS